MRWLALLVALAAGGCNTVSLVDDIDTDLDFSPLTGPSDDLHSPYVQGAKLTIYIQSSNHKVDMTQWTIASSDPTVLAITGEKHTTDSSGHPEFYIDCLAVAEGAVQLTVRDGNGRQLHQRTVAVALPDRVELMAHGLLLIGRPDADADVSEARIQAGGTATYLTRYWHGQEVLYGNGALSVESSDPSVDGHVEKTFLEEDRDWLQTSPALVGTATLGLIVGGVHVQDLPVVSVPASDVATIAIRGQDESQAHGGDWLVALAQAEDAQGRDIFGIDYDWQLDGVTQLGFGDLYRYQYDPRAPRVLTAHLGAMTASATIHGAGFVDSSNDVGCSAAPGTVGRASLPVVAALWVAVLWLAALRRRRN
jgi:hypothetical protein